MKMPPNMRRWLLIKEACKNLGMWRLIDCSLFVTLEPCPMCAGAIINSRIKDVYFGALDPKAGACGSVVDLFTVEKFNHHLMQFAVFIVINVPKC